MNKFNDFLGNEVGKLSNIYKADGLALDDPYATLKSTGPLQTFAKTASIKAFDVTKANMAKSIALSFTRPKVVDIALAGKALETRLTELFNQRIRSHMYKTVVSLQPGARIIPDKNRIAVSLNFTPAFDIDDLIEILKNSKLEQIEINKLK